MKSWRSFVHRERPEGIRRRQLAPVEVNDVLLVAAERLAVGVAKTVG